MGKRKAAAPIVPSAGKPIKKRKPKTERIAEAKARDAEFEARMAAAAEPGAGDDDAQEPEEDEPAAAPEVHLITLEMAGKADVDALALASATNARAPSI